MHATDLDIMRNINLISSFFTFIMDFIINIILKQIIDNREMGHVQFLF